MKLSSVPRKLGENVKEAQVSVGYAYLTYDNRLFALGGDILTKNTQHLFVPDGHCIANNVQSFSFPGPLCIPIVNIVFIHMARIIIP